MAIKETAFKIPKYSQDFSQVSGLFTFDIPDAIFKVHEKINGVVHTYASSDDAVYAKSVDSELVCEAGPNTGDITIVHTKRHPRLHPNRGLIFSPSAFVDSYDLTGAEIEYGIFNLDGDTLEIRDGITVVYLKSAAKYEIYARVYSKGIKKYDVLVDPAQISRLDGKDGGFIPAQGHLLDIQGQWRGVGNWVWWLSSPYDGESHVVHTFAALNDLNNLSVSNPAMHAGFIARNNGAPGKIRAGCIDVSSEGGGDDIQVPRQVGTNDDVNTSASGTVLLAFRVPPVFKDKLNTRDIQIYSFLASCVARARVHVYVYSSEDGIRLTKGAGIPIVDADWTQAPAGSCVQYIDNSVSPLLITGFDETGIAPVVRFPLPAGTPFEFKFPDSYRVPRWLVHGDIVVVEGYATNADMNVFAFYGELV